MTEPESTPTSQEPESNNPPETPAQNSATNESAKLLEQRARELQDHIQGFGDEVRTLANNLETRKRETTVLKIMLYTGVVVMMVAFFYSSNALHEAQLKSFEANLNHMQKMMQANIEIVERSVQRQVKGLQDEIRVFEKKVEELEGRQSTYYLKEQKLSEVVKTLNEAVGPLAKNNPQLAGKLNELTRKSEALTRAYKGEPVDETGASIFGGDPGSVIFP